MVAIFCDPENLNYLNGQLVALSKTAFGSAVAESMLTEICGRKFNAYPSDS